MTRHDNIDASSQGARQWIRKRFSTSSARWLGAFSHLWPPALLAVSEVNVVRDEKDPGTLEMPLPAKRGRPPKYSSGAMSAAERAAAYRRNRKNDAHAAWRKDVSDAAMIDALRDAMARGEADYALKLLADLRMRAQEMKS